MTVLFVFWQDSESRRWFPVAELSRVNGHFEFRYTQGAKQAPNFLPFGRMSNLDSAYESELLFPFFANRVMSPSRPEYTEYLQWLGLESSSRDPLKELARSGGIRPTDHIQVHGRPDRTDGGTYEIEFFCHGSRYLPAASQERLEQLVPEERLYPMLDVANEFDKDAVAIRTNAPVFFVGYTPRFFAVDIRRCGDRSGWANTRFTVRRVNENAPWQMRLLCRFVAPWPPGFRPFDGDEFKPVVPSSDNGMLATVRTS